LFVKYPDGTPYSGQVWPGWSCFPDFTSEEARTWWGDKMKGIIEDGVTGFWNDMNEPAAWGQHLPDLIEFEYEGEGATHKKARNVYGMQMARSTYEGAKRQMNGKRPFVLTRAGFSGVQRYAAVWTGDNVSNDEHMMAGIRLINSMGLAGIPYAGYDVGGFAGEASPELMSRWISIGAFSPFFRAHSMVNSKDSEPWSFGEETEDISRNYIKLRYRLMPYLYSSFRESSINGMPVARSLAIDYTHDERVYQSAYQHQYLFGNAFLVMPIPSNAEFAKIFLPAGKWINFYTDELEAGGTEHIIEISKEVLPLYVKAGSVIPMQSQLYHLKEKPEPVLNIHVYGGSDGEFSYYEDDGETYAFENGDYFSRNIKMDWKNRVLQFEAAEGKFSSKFTQLKIYFHACDAVSARMSGKDMPLVKEDIKYIEPVSDYDPYHKPPKPPMLIKDVPVLEVPHTREGFEILFN
jgi:alpha-glucosidase